MTITKTLFWASAGLLAYTHVGYPLGLAAVAPFRHRRPTTSSATPDVSVIVAAYAEQDVIAARVANLRALDYPSERLEILIACDGSPDATADALLL